MTKAAFVSTLFDLEMKDNWDKTKTFASVENLEKALTKLGVTKENRPILVKVPHGKNEGRFTVIFPWEKHDGKGGNNNWAIFSGFKVFN